MGMIACYQMVDDEVIAELLNKDADEVFEEIEALQETEGAVLDIDKLWDGLHFLLTKVSASEPLSGNLLSEAIVGVERFGDEDADYIAYILRERVNAILNAFKDFDIEGAIENFQPKEVAKTGIYPNIWMSEDKNELQEELKECFCAMLNFFQKAAELRKAVIVSIY